VPDDAFADARLAALYDVAEVDRDDLVHYERIVGEFDAASVLDLGCGTGTLACRLAGAGLDVVGVDPARASLNLAKSKDHTGNVRWLHGDAVAAATELATTSIDMALMTGNVAQVFLGDDWHETLLALRHLLRPGGHLVFETRDPAYRGWEEWTRDRSHAILRSQIDGPVETWVDLVEVALPFVSFRWTYRFSDGTEQTSNSTLRFRDRAEIEASLARAGYDIVDVRDAPDRPGKEFVFIARNLASDTCC